MKIRWKWLRQTETSLNNLLESKLVDKAEPGPIAPAFYFNRCPTQDSASSVHIPLGVSQIHHFGICNERICDAQECLMDLYGHT
jgi:hypothetical protein